MYILLFKENNKKLWPKSQIYKSLFLKSLIKPMENVMQFDIWVNFIKFLLAAFEAVDLR